MRKIRLNWSTTADGDPVVTNTLQKWKFLHLRDTIPFFKIIREVQSLFLPQKGRADQAETGFEVILKFMQRRGAQ